MLVPDDLVLSEDTGETVEEQLQFWRDAMTNAEV